ASPCSTPPRSAHISSRRSNTRSRAWRSSRHPPLPSGCKPGPASRAGIARLISMICRTAASTRPGLPSALPISLSVMTSATTAPPPADKPAHAGELRVLICCDAAIERNGVGSYYADLIDQIGDSLAAIELIAPGRGPRPLASFPLPGDRSQRIALPAPWRMAQIFDALRPHVVIVATPGPAGMIGARLARRRGLPFIYGFHTHFEALSALYWN